MFEYYEDLKDTPLFHGMSRGEVEACFSCLKTRVCSYRKGEVIFSAGQEPTNVGIILEGGILTSKNDIDGKNILLYDIDKGSTIGEIFAYDQKTISGFYATASSAPTRVLYMNKKQFFSPCSAPCRAAHLKMINNLPRILVSKLFLMTQRVTHLVRGSVRDKILSYLQEERDITRCFNKSGGLNKSMMAVFLHVNRATLSKELTRMRAEGVIGYDRRRIWLNRDAEEGRV